MLNILKLHSVRLCYDRRWSRMRNTAVG